MKRKTEIILDEVRDYFKKSNKNTTHLSQDKFNDLLEYFPPVEQAAFRIDGRILLDGKWVVRI